MWCPRSQRSLCPTCRSQALWIYVLLRSVYRRLYRRLLVKTCVIFVRFINTCNIQLDSKFRDKFYKHFNLVHFWLMKLIEGVFELFQEGVEESFLLFLFLGQKLFIFLCRHLLVDRRRLELQHKLPNRSTWWSICEQGRNGLPGWCPWWGIWFFLMIFEQSYFAWWYNVSFGL